MASGLYRLDEFRDNCGFGLIAHTKGESSHRLLQTAIEALTCMTHRGGIAADGKTGDGCGLLIQKPDVFFRSVASDFCETNLPEFYAVGVIMLNQDADYRTQSKAVIAEELARQGLKLAGWRVVPTNPECLGPIALETLPVIEHLFIAAPKEMEDQQFDARLFIARRHIENRLAEDKAFYIASFSATVVCYKGLMMPVDLPHFYTDITYPRL